MKDKIIEILKDADDNSHLFSDIATRIDSLYSRGVSEKKFIRWIAFKADKIYLEQMLGWRTVEELYNDFLKSDQSHPTSENSEVVNKESNIADSIERIFKNNERIHGKSKSIDWIKLSAHKTASYLLQSHPTPKISEEEIKNKFATLVTLFTAYWDYSEHNNKEPYPSEVDKLFKTYANYRDELIQLLSKGAQPMSEEEIDKIAHAFAKEEYGEEGYRTAHSELTVTIMLFKKYCKLAINKRMQPEVVHCTQCGYHYDSLLKECPTCKGVKPTSEENRENIITEINNEIQPHAITLEHGEKATQAVYDLIYGKN